MAHAFKPKRFNGLMIVGEGPGTQEVAEGRPFVGPSGKLLRAMLKQSGIHMDECWVTNATLGKPTAHKQPFMKDFPNAVTSCLPRLEAEIEAVRPRVILALGGPALVSLTGYDEPKVVRTENPCDKCNEQRKVGPVLECQAPVPLIGDGSFNESKACGYLHYFAAESKETVDPEEFAKVKEAGCPQCRARFKNVRPKMIKCPHCGGRKFKHEDTFVFTWDYNIGDVAGAVFTPALTGTPRAEHNISSWFSEHGVQYLVPSFHPAFLLRDQQFMAEASLKHLAKVRSLLDGVKPHYKLNYQVTSDPDVVCKFLFGWRGRKEKPPEFEVDLETEPKQDYDGKNLDARFPPDVARIKVIGIGTADAQLVVDTRACDPSDPNDKLLGVLSDFLCDPEIPKCYHNGACYDIPVLDIVWGVPAADQIKSYQDDTLGMHAILCPDEPHKLSHVAFSYTDAYAWKPPRTANGVEIHESFDELALYNARDIYNTSRSREAMRREIPTRKLQRVDEIDRKIRKISVKMTMAGMPINMDKRRIVKERVEQQVAKARADTLAPLYKLKLIEEVDPSDPKAKPFNPLSPPQLGWLLFDKAGFGLKPLSYTDKGAPQTNEATIFGLMSATRDADVKAFFTGLLALREHSKTLSTYITSHEAAPWAIDNRVHSFWKPWGARTGRFSSTKINLQNQPKWIRDMYEAGPGRVIVGADEDQLELRILAALCGDPVLTHKCMTADDKRKLEPDHDPHSFVASVAFGNVYGALLLKDPAHNYENPQCKCQTCKRKALRDVVKRVIYALNYGSGDKTILEAIYSTGEYNGPPIDLAMVGHVRKTIFATFKEIEPWQSKLLLEAQETSEIRTALHGRARLFPLNEISATEVKNFPIQGFGADLLNEILIELDRRLPDVDPSAFLLAQVHDAIYVEAAEDRGEAVAKLMGEVMTREYNGMKFTASGSVAKDWKSAA
jgi:DNA polymerase I-like protein with 3'-5' exonuclease and polymerase domains/uracil-DNA glycosylase